MRSLAIIPARGGSKRIPRKNIKPFLNKPIIAYAIETALNSGLFDEVMVSTDDQEIAEIAIQFGAQVPFLRSDKNADDQATTFEVIEEVLNEYSLKGQKFDYACCIYPCTPLLQKLSLQESLKLLKDKKYDCVFPIIKYGFPIQRSIFLEEGLVKMNHPEHLITRSQDLADNYHDAGQFYFFKTEALLKSKKLYTENTGAIEVSEIDAQDIDNEVDWKLAELKYKLRATL